QKSSGDWVRNRAPTRRSSDLGGGAGSAGWGGAGWGGAASGSGSGGCSVSDSAATSSSSASTAGRAAHISTCMGWLGRESTSMPRSEEHTPELQSRESLVCRLL